LFDTSLFNILNKVNEGRETRIVLPNSGGPLLASGKCPFCVLLHEPIAKNQDESLEESLYQEEGGNGERNPIQIAIWVERTLAPGVFHDKGGVPVLGWGRGG
jgi:hypothetical protein